MKRWQLTAVLLAFAACQAHSGGKLGFIRKQDGFVLTNIPVASFRAIKQYKNLHRQEYRELATAAALKYNLSFELLDAVIEAESGYDPFCVSHKGARGLMQLMPKTARELGVTDSFDPAQNIDGGARYLRAMLDRYDNVQLGLAAYNAGPRAVDKYEGIPPYRETQGYVKRITRKIGKPDTGLVKSKIKPKKKTSPKVRFKQSATGGIILTN